MPPRPMNYPELPKIGAQFSSAGGSVRKVKLGVPPSFPSSCSRHEVEERVVPASCVPVRLRQEHRRAGTNGWRTPPPSSEQPTFEIERGKRSVKEEESGDGTIYGGFIFRPRRSGIIFQRSGIASGLKKVGRIDIYIYIVIIGARTSSFPPFSPRNRNF